ncbi:uncharacterized protein LOC100950074 [Otolemur garnettii]|uniref:uncharacterized protein LOC100950074 n=1 Tax=Otolemur garnettii TaxID=30611 RepID=UPI0006447700|nr:uncharacterized protein LOC100950074 [Otolemur garnettii]
MNLLRHKLCTPGTKNYPPNPPRSQGKLHNYTYLDQASPPQEMDGSAPGDERMMQGMGKQKNILSEKEDESTQAKPESLYTNKRNSEFLVSILRKWGSEETWDRWNLPKSLPQTFSDGVNKKKKPKPELVVHIERVAKYHHKAIIILQPAWWHNILKCKCQGRGVSRMLLIGAHVLPWVVLCSARWSCFCLL